MHLIPLESISIPPYRQRSEVAPAALEELVNSLSNASGLIHPLAVRAPREGETGEYMLVAGERRLSAIKLLYLTGQAMRHAGQVVPRGQVPVTFFGEMSEAEAVEAELEENIRRVDISVADRSRAIARLHELRTAQAEARGEKQTLTRTAEEAFPDHADGKGRVNAAWNALTIARNLEKIPELAKAGTEREAMKLIRRVQQREQDEKLAELVGKKAANELHRVYHADCREWLLAYEGEGFDCIIIDPPYGMGAESFGDSDGRMTGIEHDYKDTPDAFRELLNKTYRLMTEVCKPEAHLYCYCDIDGFHFLRDLLPFAGWKVFRTPLIHLKRQGGRVPLPEHGPRRCYELVLYAFRGDKRTTGVYPDVFDTTLEGENLGHGAQKPIEGYVELLRRSCRPGDLVLDCFAGTGTLIPAAHQLKLRSVTVEREAAAYGKCVARLEGLK